MATYGYLQGSGDTYPRYWFEYSYSRTSNSNVQLKITARGKLQWSGGWLGTGSADTYKIIFNASTSGASSSVVFKEKSNQWNGSEGWWGGSSPSGNGRTASLTLNIPSNTAGAVKTISVSMTCGAFSGARVSGSFNISMPALLYTSCSAPSWVSIDRTLTPSFHGGITLNWGGASGGASNPINVYYVQQKLFYPDGSVYQDWTGVSPSYNTGSTALLVYIKPDNDPFLAIARGYTRFRVRAQGTAGSSYYSGFTESSNVVYNNTRPVINSISVNDTKVPSAGGYISFSVNASDANGSGLKYEYHDQRSSEWTQMEGTTVTGIINSSNTTLYFRVYDGYDYSNVASKTISINTPIKITQTSLARVITTWPAGLSNKNNISVTADKSSFTYIIKRYYCSALVSGAFDWTNATESISITSSTTGGNIIGTDSINDIDGKYISYKITVSDGYDSATQNLTTYFLTTIPLTATPNFSVFSNSFTANYPNTQTNQFKDYLYVNWKNTFTNLTAAAPMKNIELQVSVSSTTASTSWTSVGLLGNTITQYRYDGNAINKGNYVKVRIRFLDEANKYSPFYETSFYKKAELPYIAGNIDCNFPQIYKPLSASSFRFTFDKPISENLLNSAFLNTKYTAYIIINNVTYPITLLATEVTNVGERVQIELTKARLLSFLTVPNQNLEYDGCLLKIKVTDNFGLENEIYNFNYRFSDASTIVKNIFSFDYREAPLWPTTETFSIALLTPLGDKTINLSDWSDMTKYSLVNSGEKIKFTFPNVTDTNLTNQASTEKLKYRIKIKTTTTQNSLILDSTNPDLSDAKYQDFNSQGECVYTLPAVEENTILRFAIEVIDNTNLSSGPKLFTKGVELCRYSTDSLIEFLNLDFTGTVENNSSALVKFNIADLGGSIINAARGNLTYKDRRNFERSYNMSDGTTLTNYVKSFKIYFKYSLTEDFAISEQIKIYELPTNGSYPIGSDLTNITIPSIVSTKIPFIQTSSYYAKLIFEYTKDQYQTAPTIVTTSTLYLFGDAPLVSHRKDSLGIKNKNIDAESLIHAKQSQHRNKIILEGTDTSSGEVVTNQIIINLSTGEVSGMTFILSDNDNW